MSESPGALAPPRHNPRERQNVLLLMGGIAATTEADGWSRAGLSHLAASAGYHRRALQRVKYELEAWGFVEADFGEGACLQLRLTEKGRAFRRGALNNLFPDAATLLSVSTQGEEA